MLSEWISEVQNSDYVWIVKRLSANDTGANGAHQAGPYTPRKVVFDLFPSVNDPSRHNPEKFFPAVVDSHQLPEKQLRVMWYNNAVNGEGTRNETRITQWGRSSPLLDPDSTGSLLVIAFYQPNHQNDAEGCKIWLCKTVEEEDLIEQVTGAVEPGKGIVFVPEEGPKGSLGSCELGQADILPEWFDKFPSGAEIIQLAFDRLPLSGVKPDVRLVRRRDCEFSLFLSIEQEIVFPRIRQGFKDVGEFIAFASSVMNRRKSRAGRSLELHLIKIFSESGMIEDQDFSYNKASEPGKKPDFLFPSATSYHQKSFPDDSLFMLGVKTTCKDRWRQILNEADRVPRKHLFTLQEGVSENQYHEMKESGIQLVVPQAIQGKYPKNFRHELISLEEFIDTVIPR